jgi:hypothetical protein
MLDPNTLALLDTLGIDAATAEAAMDGLVLITVITLISAVPTVMLAMRKGRSVALWLILALSLPIIPLLLVWLLPAVNKPSDHQG